MINLTSIQKKYKGKWVVFTDNFNSVVTANKDIKIAYKKAKELGYKRPTLFKVPEKTVPYLGMI